MQLFIKCLVSRVRTPFSTLERAASSALHEQRSKLSSTYERGTRSEKGASVQQARASSFCRENHRPIRRWFDSPRSLAASDRIFGKGLASEAAVPFIRKIRRPPSTSPAPNRSSVTVSAKAGVQRAASPWNPPWKGGLRGIEPSPRRGHRG